MGTEQSETQKERKSLDNQLQIHQTNTRETSETEKAADFWKKTVGSCNFNILFSTSFVHVNLGRCCHYIGKLF
jgi:hypothetical protein